MGWIFGLLLAAAAPLSGDWHLTIDGFGPIRIGMTRKQVSEAMHSPLLPVETTDEKKGCAIVSAAEYPGMYFRFERSILADITVVAPSTATTPRQIRVGSSAAAVHRSYGSALRSHPKYDYPPGGREDLVYWPSHRGVRFIIEEDRRVSAMIAGTETIFLVDGCA